jgi:hypothetical protein
MKNTSLENKNTTLNSVLTQHFKGEINQARIKLICLFITALCRVKTINYDTVNQIFNNSPSHKSIKPKTITGNSTLKTNSSMINKLILSKKRR